MSQHANGGFFSAFLRNERSAGIILVCGTLFSLIATNVFPGIPYRDFWTSSFEAGPFHLSLLHVINDGLMTVFFLVAGLEIKRELTDGELSTTKQAILPVLAAVGGMLVPALFFTLFNTGAATANGWGIPVATDIAFALGVMKLAGRGVPLSLKVFLTALAVIDDIGAIIIIAVFYNSDIQLYSLLAAGGFIVLMILMNLLKVKNTLFYLLPGIGLWYFMLHSGIHPSVAGVAAAMCIPAGISAQHLEGRLHTFSVFIIMPLFALANTCILLPSDLSVIYTETLSLGIIAGLLIGKPVGIVLFTLLAIGTGLAVLPEGVTRKSLLGVGFLGGIGFTMSIFISLLALTDPVSQDVAKIAVLCASFIAGGIGYFLLRNAKKE